MYRVLSCVLLVLIVGCGIPRTQAQPGVPTSVAADSGCAYREVSRERLLVEGGRQLYVEPFVMEANARGDLLLAGRYNYLSEPADGGKWVRAASDSILGAFIPRTGEAQIVRSPIPIRLLARISAAARSDGSWDVVFTEHPATEVSRLDTVARLWYGILDGASWRSLEVLPRPVEVIHPELSSLVRAGDTLGFAVPARDSNGLRSVLLYQQRGGRWEFEPVRTGGGGYPEVAHSDSLGFVLAVVQPDPALRRDGNSLFLWARKPSWRPILKLVAGREERVHHPRLILSGSHAVLSWGAMVPGVGGEATRELHAMVGAVTERVEPILTVARASTSLSPVRPVRLASGPYVWVFDQEIAGTEQRQIGFVQLSTEAPVGVGAFPNPFIAGFVIGAPTPGEIVIAGGIVDRMQDIVVSLLLRTHHECRGSAR